MPWLTACQSDELLDKTLSEGTQIRLSADIALPESADTRTPYEWTTPSTQNYLDASVWASNVVLSSRAGIGNFTHNAGSTGSTGTIQYQASIHFEDGVNQLLTEDLVYPEGSSEGNPVYFIGLHPNTAWAYTTDGASTSSASQAFFGYRDFMYAPQVSGYKDITLNPNLHFFHLLTWLRVEVKVSQAAAAASWGSLTNIVLNNQNRQITIDLSTVPTIDSDFSVTQTNIGNLVTFSSVDPTTLDLYVTDSNTSLGAAAPITLTTTETEVAYVLCEPFKNATNENPATYNMTVYTENRSDGVPVSVTLKSDENTNFTGSTMGRQFVITLTFGEGGYISSKARVTEWLPGGYITKDVEE